MVSRVYIFDAVDDGGPATMNDRVAECYAWAEQRGLTVLDEIVSWTPNDITGRELALDRAVTACHRDRAALLVHSRAVLPNNRAQTNATAPARVLVTAGASS
jgi:hypothetical protein